ncbi:MAG: FAD-dependent oxidoreductase [Bacteroidota bacterium]
MTRPAGWEGERPRIAVVGGGIAGLAGAHRLARSAAEVTLYEASASCGGLGAFFPYGGTHLEKFYHCLLPGDDHLLELLGELDMRDSVYWRTAEFGFMHEGRLYGLNTPRELLAFKPLPLVSRFRVGFTGLYASRVSSGGLDEIPAEEWLVRLSGRRAFETLWKPMLQAKFGERYHEIPALWFWTRFNREKGTRKEVKGYIRGGYRRLTELLVDSLRGRGVRLRMNSPVEHLDLDEGGRPVLSSNGARDTYDAVLITTPLALFRSFASGERMAPWTRRVDPGIDYQGVVNVLLVLRRSLTPYYWVAALHPEIPFQGIVESSVLLEKEDTGGHHLAYMMNYVHRTDPLYARSDEELVGDALRGLRVLFPDFNTRDVRDSFVFRAPFVEPLYTLGYLEKKPPGELVPGRVWLATAAQVYPAVTSWNSSAGLGRDAAGKMLGALGPIPA